MTEKDFVLPNYPLTSNSGKITWRAPSNIALIKYWGKHGVQIPSNPSLSFTLSSSATTTQINFEALDKASDKPSYDFYFHGEAEDSFRPKIDAFFERIGEYLPFIKRFHFRIDSSNSFPHSSGIASSASGFAALSLCLMDLERLMNPNMTQEFFEKKASFLARLGSGSACRSVKGPLMHWGKHQNVEGSDDLFAISYPGKVDAVFTGFKDAILLVDKGKKKVSSTVGHGLMKGHAYAQQRFDQAHKNLGELKASLEQGDLEKFIEIVESEALGLHAMMMTSIPYFLLMKPNTVAIIERLWDFRRQSGLGVCFTLDAGANVHLLYPQDDENKVNAFIQSELAPLCEDGSVLYDWVGPGSSKVE